MDYILFYYFTEFYDIICDDVVRKNPPQVYFLFPFMSSLTVSSAMQKKTHNRESNVVFFSYSKCLFYDKCMFIILKL